jgi:hypothetical protein
MQVFALALIGCLRPGDSGFGLAAMAYVPATLLGALGGLAMFERLDNRQFAVAANLTLIASGIGLLAFSSPL